MAYLLDHGPVPEWTELRDDSGHLYGRVQREEWLLEIRRNGRRVVFRLTDYLREAEYSGVSRPLEVTAPP